MSIRVLEAAIVDASARLAADGRRPFTIPVGGASPMGVVAYADAVDELRAQVAAARVDDPDWIVVADGSGGTHAGIIAGLGKTTTRVVGVDVGTRPDLDDAVPRLAAEAAAMSGRPRPSVAAVVDHDHYGDGYGRLTPSGLEAMTLAARTEALVLDPVYTGKAMAGLIARVRDGRITADESVLFWHTGGAPALFDARYAHCFDATENGAGRTGAIRGTRCLVVFLYAARTLRATTAPSATSTRSSNSFFTMTSSAGWSRQRTGAETAVPSAKITPEVNGVWWPPSSSTRVGRANPVRWVRFLPPPPTVLTACLSRVPWSTPLRNRYQTEIIRRRSEH